MTVDRQKKPANDRDKVPELDERSLQIVIAQWLRAHALARAEQPIATDTNAALINATAAQTMLVIARAIENREYMPPLERAQ